MEMSSALQSAYGESSLNQWNNREAALYKNYLAGNITGSELINHVSDQYDSSADFWKLIMNADGTHRIIDDNSRELTLEYRDDDGIILNSITPEGQIASRLGWAASLGNVVGLERASEILGSGLDNADLYDTQTLKDVLCLPDQVIRQIQKSGTLSGLNLTQNQKLSLAGEAFLKNAGASWNSGSGRWENTESLSLTLTDNILNGNILARLNDSGGFEYSTITAAFQRDTDSYKSAIGDRTYQGLDSLYLFQNDLDGNVINSGSYSGFQTVDIMDKGKLDQPFSHPDYGSVQGNTVAPGEFWMRTGIQSNYPSEAWLIHDAETIDGTSIGADGNAVGSYGYDRAGRWLSHQNKTKDRDDYAGIDFPFFFMDGCFGTSSQYWKKILEDVNEWGMYPNYDIKTKLYEFNY